MSQKVLSALKANKVERIEGLLDKVNHGIRADIGLTDPISPLHVMDCIRSADKTIKGFLYKYDMICEFSHPNCTGNTHWYSDINPETSSISFGPNVQSSSIIKGHGINSLGASLDLCVLAYGDIDRDVVEQYIPLK